MNGSNYPRHKGYGFYKLWRENEVIGLDMFDHESFGPGKDEANAALVELVELLNPTEQAK